MPTAIHGAAMVRCLPCFELLQRYKADVNIAVPTLPVVTWLDSRAETRDILEWLEHYGVRMDRTGADGRSALHAAAGASDIAIVEWLLQKGLDPLARDATGMNALMYAGYMRERANGRLPVALRLMELTADLRSVSTGGAQKSGPFPELQLPDINGWTLGLYAATEPRFREAARRAGKTLDYAHAPPGTQPFHRLGREGLDRLAADMSDAELVGAFAVGRQDDVLWPGLPMAFASLGAVSAMERALSLGLMESALSRSGYACDILLASIIGNDDRSPAKIESWRAAKVLLRARIDRADVCDATRASVLVASLRRRTPEEREEWNKLVKNLPRA
jgi:hypothetical protein